MGKTFVVIDGYTLAIAQNDSGVLFSGCHSRRALTRYDDSALIEFLAHHAQNESFWQCFQAHETYENEDDSSELGEANRFFVRDSQQLIRDRSWKLPQAYQNWAIWELIDQLQGQSCNEPICLWHPGSFYRMYCIPYRTAFKIMQVARNWACLPAIEGIEVLNEIQWNVRFASSASSDQPLLISQILDELEETASLYLLLFEDQARLYTPNQVEGIRYELLNQMSIANLLDREISTEILDCLATYPNLQRCVIQAEKLWRYLDCASVRQDKDSLSLDWMFFDPPYPELGFHKLCLQQLKQAKLQYPHTIPFEAYGKHYRLVTGRVYHHAMTLLTVLEIETPANAIALFANVNEPTYLELVAWAALESCPPPIETWEMAVDWKNREDELATLATDPSLPKAEFFLNCLSSHLARLWQNGDRAALRKGLQSLQYHFSKETYFLYCRGQMLLSGTLPFHYAEWFDGGFLRLYQSEH